MVSSITKDKVWNEIVNKMSESGKVNDALVGVYEFTSVQFIPSIAFDYMPNVLCLNTLHRFMDGSILEKVLSETISNGEINRVVDDKKIILKKDDEPVVYLLSKKDVDLHKILGNYEKHLGNLSSNLMTDAINEILSTYKNVHTGQSSDQGFFEFLKSLKPDALRFENNVLKVDFPKIVELTRVVLNMDFSKNLLKYNKNGFEIDVGKGFELLENNLPYHVVVGSFADGIAVVRENFLQDKTVIFKPNGRMSFQEYKIME
ncbi:MAG: hypothetical protein ACP5N3_03475 [Candidatus Nanoarchaeia archaeon]